MSTILSTQDPEIADLIAKETTRQRDGLVLIPSENYASQAVLDALGTPLTNKYAEGYPGKRYYSGNEFVDGIETLAIERAKSLFGVPYANVQPYSGSPANLAVYAALCEPGDAYMGLDLMSGGHLTHGWKASFTSRAWKSVPYHVLPDGSTDLEEVRRLALENKPKFIWCGGTALPRAIPFKELAAIAEEAGAYLVADISHIAGLIAGGAHESPVPYAHVITTTTHKTLRGPRGAMILVTDKGVAKDPELPEKIDKAIIPGLQGGPHMNAIAAIAVALREAAQPEFKQYATDVVKNAKALADALTAAKLTLVSGGTDNHLVLIDLSAGGIGRGAFLHLALERAHIYANKNAVPHDASSAFYPSGLRVGTPALTSRGMGTDEMKHVGEWIGDIASRIANATLPEDKGGRIDAMKRFRAMLKDDSSYDSIAKDVATLCAKFPAPGINP